MERVTFHGGVMAQSRRRVVPYELFIVCQRLLLDLSKHTPACSVLTPLPGIEGSRARSRSSAAALSAPTTSQRMQRARLSGGYVSVMRRRPSLRRGDRRRRRRRWPSALAGVTRRSARTPSSRRARPRRPCARRRARQRGSDPRTHDTQHSPPPWGRARGSARAAIPAPRRSWSQGQRTC